MSDLKIMRLGSVVVVAALLVTPLAAHAQKKVPYWSSINAGKARMRTGPGQQFPASWMYQRAGLPVHPRRVALLLSAGFLLIALGLAFASVFSRVQPMVFGETTLKPLAHPPALVPVFLHLGLGLAQLPKTSRSILRKASHDSLSAVGL